MGYNASRKIIIIIIITLLATWTLTQHVHEEELNWNK